jgi:hypothetical protein
MRSLNPILADDLEMRLGLLMRTTQVQTSVDT